MLHFIVIHRSQILITNDLQNWNKLIVIRNAIISFNTQLSVIEQTAVEHTGN